MAVNLRDTRIFVACFIFFCVCIWAGLTIETSANTANKAASEALHANQRTEVLAKQLEKTTKQLAATTRELCRVSQRRGRDDFKVFNNLKLAEELYRSTITPNDSYFKIRIKAHDLRIDSYTTKRDESSHLVLKNCR